MVTEVLALLCVGAFAGAAAYITFVEHPARMECDAECALAQWLPSYRRAMVMQASMAVLGVVLGLFAWWSDPRMGWFLGSLMLVAAVAFTLTVIRPVNHQLENPELAPEEARELLVRWGELHNVRSVLGVLAFLLFALAVADYT